MTNKIVLSEKFKRKYKKFTKNNDHLQKVIDDSIRLLGQDVFHPKLKTHSLYGSLKSFHACNCGYDCRILMKIFIEKDPIEILLLDLGTHDEVY